MTLKSLLISLGRRWYLTIAGVLITAGLCTAAYANTSPTLERSASDLLVPGKTTIPEGGNPYLYLGGLAQVADVLVSSLRSETTLGAIADDYPGTTLSIGRDTSTSGPMITMTVSGESDAAVAGALTALADQVPKALADLQTTAGVPDEARISVLSLTKDTTSTTIQKGRIELVGMIGAAGLVLTVLLVGLIDGLMRGRRQRAARPEPDGPESDAAEEPRRAVKERKRKAGREPAAEPVAEPAAEPAAEAAEPVAVGTAVDAGAEAEPETASEPQAADQRAADSRSDDDIDWDAFFAETGHSSIRESRDR